jgi:coenzyme PQQ precursor peptide PqqA
MKRSVLPRAVTFLYLPRGRITALPRLPLLMAGEDHPRHLRALGGEVGDALRVPANGSDQGRACQRRAPAAASRPNSAALVGRYVPSVAAVGAATAGRSTMKKTWTTPQVLEKPVSLEVTMYLPAEPAR